MGFNHVLCGLMGGGWRGVHDLKEIKTGSFRITESSQGLPIVAYTYTTRTRFIASTLLNIQHCTIELISYICW